MSLVAQGGGPPAVRAAIVRALQARQYTVEMESGQEIVASYQRGRHFLQVSIAYEPTAFHITPMRLDGMTERHYERYVAELEQSVQQELARPDREAQARAVAARPVVVMGGGAIVGVAPGYASCESLVVGYGHPPSSTVHCRPQTDVVCADALLSLGHPTNALLFCNDVEPNCARQWLLSGGAPVALNRCRY